MATQTLLARFGLRLAVLGTAANLAFAAPLSAGSEDPAAHTDASRIGIYFDRTGAAEKIGFVVLGTERLAITTVGVTVSGAISCTTLTASGVVLADGVQVHRGTPTSNLFLGLDAGNATMTGVKNLAVGFETLKSNTSGFENIAIGHLALNANTGGFYNVAVGSEALKVSTTGAGNVAVGGGALVACTTGGTNAAVGFEALRQVTTGSYNSLLGCDSGAGLTTGSRNTILGANITGLAADLQANIIIANGLGGAGAIKARHDGTKWVLWDLIECLDPTDATSRFAAAFTIDGGLGVHKGVHAGRLTLTPDVITSGSPTLMLLTGAAHTTLAASVEVTDVNFNLARTVQFSTGALATQRTVRIQAATYAFVGASTITNAATLAISGAPIAGANATITNSYALWVQGGTTRLDGVVSFDAAVNTKQVALTDAASITTDASLGNGFTVTLGGNRTLANPTNLVAGSTYLWQITQDGTGTRTLAYGNLFKWPGGTVPVLTTASGGIDVITAYFDGAALRAVAALAFA